MERHELHPVKSCGYSADVSLNGCSSVPAKQENLVVTCAAQIATFALPGASRS